MLKSKTKVYRIQLKTPEAAIKCAANIERLQLEHELSVIPGLNIISQFYLD